MLPCCWKGNIRITWHTGKLVGEVDVRGIEFGGTCCILRAGWVEGSHGPNTLGHQMELKRSLSLKVVIHYGARNCFFVVTNGQTNSEGNERFSHVAAGIWWSPPLPRPVIIYKEKAGSMWHPIPSLARWNCNRHTLIYSVYRMHNNHVQSAPLNLLPSSPRRTGAATAQEHVQISLTQW